jgi:hypothetical protein
MADRDTLGTLVGEFASAFRRFSASFRSPTAFADFLEELGWRFDPVPQSVIDLQTPVGRVVDFIAQGEVTADDVPELLRRVLAAFTAISDIANAGDVPDAFKSEFPRQLVDFILVDYLLAQQPRWGFLLMALRIIRLEVSTAPGRPPFVRRTFAVEDLSPLVSDPLTFLEDSYRWGESDFKGQVLADSLAGIMNGWGLAIRYPLLDLQTRGLLTAGALSPAQVSGVSPQLSLIEDALDAARLGAGVGLYLLPETATDKPGFAMLPYVAGSFEDDIPVTDDLTLAIKGNLDLTGGVGLFVRPNQDVSFFSGMNSGGPAPVTGDLTFTLKLGEPDAPIVIVGTPDASRMELGGVSATAGARFRSGLEVFAEFGLEKGKIVVKPSDDDSDGFVASLLPKDGLELDFDLMVGFSTTKGLYFGGSGKFEIDLPVHVSLGPVEIVSAKAAVRVQDGGIPVDLAATIAGDFSILKATVQNVGLTAAFTFPGDRKGNLGPVDMRLGFKAPDGVGLSIDTGAVRGGGFLFIDQPNGRYAGAIELAAFGISVKAFGVIDTKFPDGSKGFSFVIIVVAEFTPIQLGFGFTLLGVGGLLGVNRSLNEQGLSDAVRTGSLEHVLFPHDPVHDAPAIIHDLATIFPAAKDHFVIGPMGKLGWGTPTLISADLGIVIEFPGPRIAVLGVLRMLLPDPEDAIVALQMAVAGLLDFPAKKFSLDASLFDSTVAGYAVTGDMAFRLQWGDNAKFLMSVGGFNTGFSAPAPFPDLRRVSVDFGVNGNPSLVASGYFALTSNTAQIGSSIQLHASGYGITVDGWMGFDVLFVFSPFSLDASISAGMRASFHGHGFGITLHGNLTGPTPWHLQGKVCVSILWWDACLPIDVTFGDRQPVALPQIDPWDGSPPAQIEGLKQAISDPRNWSGTSGPAELPVVSLAASDRTPIDPLGSATLRQKVAPFNRKLEKFGEFKPIVHDRFDLGPSGGSVGVVVPGLPDPVSVTELAVVQDDFAPGHFMQLSNAQKLSMPSYVPMDAGVSVAADRISLGSSDAKAIEYVTKFIDDEGGVHEGAKHQLTDAQLAGLLKRSPAALGGVRRTGTERFMLADRPKKIRLNPSLFLVADACTMVRNSAVTGAPISQAEALLALREHLRTNPEDADLFAVIPKYAEAA